MHASFKLPNFGDACISSPILILSLLWGQAYFAPTVHVKHDTLHAN